MDDRKYKTVKLQLLSILIMLFTIGVTNAQYELGSTKESIKVFYADPEYADVYDIIDSNNILIVNYKDSVEVFSSTFFYFDTTQTIYYDLDGVKQVDQYTSCDSIQEIYYCNCNCSDCPCYECTKQIAEEVLYTKGYGWREYDQDTYIAYKPQAFGVFSPTEKNVSLRHLKIEYQPNDEVCILLKSVLFEMSMQEWKKFKKLRNIDLIKQTVQQYLVK
ncbi:MAG: hypothetical protein MK212_17360 [Saprospiraceae bacterium]|nr:hypothetical protein [Saprospiraceae bacterium]